MDNLVQIFRKIILGEKKSWVLFKNGTCVIIMKVEENLREQAIALLKEYGPVHVGSPSADFQIIKLADEKGWVVGCHHPDVLTYVSPEDFANSPTELMVGIRGRSKRDQDSEDLEVVHVEDKSRL